MTKKVFAFGILTLLFAPTPAWANMIWPAWFLERRLFTWEVIAVGFIIECLFVRWLFDVPWPRVLVATVVANACSALLGVTLIAGGGFALTAITDLFFGWPTFGRGNWAFAFVLACLANAVVECASLNFASNLRVLRRDFLWLIAANALSVALAFGGLIIEPVPGQESEMPLRGVYDSPAATFDR